MSKQAEFRMGVGAAAREALATASAELCLRLGAARARTSTEGVHKLRVASRRMAAVLEAFRSAVKRAPDHDALAAAMRRLRDALGDVRDLDVQSDVLEGLGKDAPPACARLVSSLTGELSARRPGAEAKLDAALGAFEEETLPLLARVTAHAKGRTRAGRAVTKRLAHRARQVRARADEAAAGDGAPDALHALRRSAKKLRYLVEVAGDAVSNHASAQLLSSLQSLQTHLGRIHDLDVLLARLHARATSDTDERRALDWLAARAAGERSQLAEDLDTRLDPRGIETLAGAHPLH